MILYLTIVALLTGSSAAVDTPEVYRSNIQFILFNNNSLSTSPSVSNLNTSMTDQGCDPQGNFTLVIHGWMEGFITPWVSPLIKNFLFYRGGCVIFMNYTKYSNVSNYFVLVDNWKGIAAVLVEKTKQIGNFERMLCFGFSFGSRLCIEAGKQIGNQSIDRMELCDPASPGFNYNDDPKPAAKNVACINTSTDKGTDNYNCHQNFRMGSCGRWQAAAGEAPLGNHGLCPYFYNLAFTNDFVSNNFYKCNSARLAKNITSDVKMGLNANFNRTLVQGDIFIATAQFVPYVVVNNVVNNAFTPLMRYMNVAPQTPGNGDYCSNEPSS